MLHKAGSVSGNFPSHNLLLPAHKAGSVFAIHPSETCFVLNADLQQPCGVLYAAGSISAASFLTRGESLKDPLKDPPLPFADQNNRASSILSGRHFPNKSLFRSQIYSNRAACYTKLAAMPEGLKDAEKTIELAPDFVRGYERKGSVQFFMKKYEDAMETYQQGLKIDPNNQELQDGIRRCGDSCLLTSACRLAGVILLFTFYSSFLLFAKVCPKSPPKRSANLQRNEGFPLCHVWRAKCSCSRHSCLKTTREIEVHDLVTLRSIF